MAVVGYKRQDNFSSGVNKVGQDTFLRSPLNKNGFELKDTSPS